MPTLQSKQIWTVALVALILGLLFDYLFWGKVGLGINFFVYTALLLSGFFVLSNWLKLAFNKELLWYIVPILFFSAMLAVRDSMFLSFWNFVLTLGLLLVFAHHNTGKSIKDYAIFDLFKTAIALPLKFLAASFRSLGELLAIRKIVKENQKAEQIVKGIIITIPILVLFVVLLSSADLVFGRLISNIFNFKLNLDSLARPWWIFVFFFIWLGVYSYILQNLKQSSDIAIDKISNYQFGKIEAGILFGVLNLVFLVFVIIQLKYLFAGESAITNLGFTYAEYARKGFFELITAAVFSLLMVFGVEKYVQKGEGRHLNIFKFLSTGLIALVLVMMVSAFLRLSLYEGAYGFTVMRFMSQAFIVWLALIFLLLLYKIFSFSKENEFLFWTFMSVLVFFAGLNLTNPEALIARKNIEKFAKGNKLDTHYLSTLSADAVPEIVKLLDRPGLKSKTGVDLTFEIADILKFKRNSLHPDYDSAKQIPWQSFNFSRDRAIELINQNWQRIESLSKQFEQQKQYEIQKKIQ